MTKENQSSLKKAWLYFYRSARLRCPVCGVSPLFQPVTKIRSGLDWFETLPGCSHCDYAYDQEPGYFMLALWMFDYGAAALFGIGLFLILFNFFELSTGKLLLFTLVPTIVLAVLIVRHAKAFYLALDHYFFHGEDQP
jgi:uncharacterized protein (DUF983 family)